MRVGRDLRDLCLSGVHSHDRRTIPHHALMRLEDTVSRSSIRPTYQHTVRLGKTLRNLSKSDEYEVRNSLETLAMLLTKNRTELYLRRALFCRET